MTNKETMEITTTYLEMTSPPKFSPQPHPAGKIMMLRLDHPTVPFYRYLFNSVGDTWSWRERNEMSDLDLTHIIKHPNVDIYVLYVGGVPAGFAEVDRRREVEVELKYFGLMPEYIGQGYGFFFIREVVQNTWTYNPKRFWLHTCDQDHPKALTFYQKLGFIPYKQEKEVVEAPTPEFTFTMDPDI